MISLHKNIIISIQFNNCKCLFFYSHIDQFSNFQKQTRNYISSFIATLLLKEIIKLQTNHNLANSSQQSRFINLCNSQASETQKQFQLQINMIQKLTQKEPNLEKPYTIKEQAKKLLKNRAMLLKNNADQEFLENIMFQQKWDAYQEIIDHFQEQPRKTQKFRLHSLAGGTRSWEGLSLDQNNQRRFKIEQKDLQKRIIAEFEVNLQIMSEQVDIQKIRNDHPLILAAKKNMIRNYQIVGKIIKNENLLQAIEQFFTKTKFYSYSFTHVKTQRPHGLESSPKQEEHFNSEIQQSESQDQKQEATGGPNNLQGLSAFNGKKTYINKILFDNAVKQLHLLETLEPLGNNNSLYDNLLDLFKALVTLEHEGLHNLIRFVMNNENPQLISPEKNDELRIDGEMQEAGHYYAEQAYGIKADVSPFCLNIQKLQ
ncbi:hypothetical protein pb186bvf_020351 [Paramecium bursaria]